MECLLQKAGEEVLPGVSIITFDLIAMCGNKELV